MGFRGSVFAPSTQAPARHTTASAAASTLALGTEPTAQSHTTLGLTWGAPWQRLLGVLGHTPLGWVRAESQWSHCSSSLRGAVLSAGPTPCPGPSPHSSRLVFDLPLDFVFHPAASALTSPWPAGRLGPALAPSPVFAVGAPDRPTRTVLPLAGFSHSGSPGCCSCPGKYFRSSSP